MGCCSWRGSDQTPSEDTEPPAADETALARRIARAEADLVAATGGAPLCRVGNGPPAGSAKHAEGRYAALRSLRHLLRSPDPVLLASAIELLATWQADRARSGSQGPAWTAYRDGGVAELQGLVDALTTAESARC